MKRNSLIDILRLVFSVLIVLFHSQVMFGSVRLFGPLYLCGRGDIIVEFFFILTGLLTAKHVDTKEQVGTLGQDSYIFIKKKYLSILPYMLFAWFFSVIAYCVNGGLGTKQMLFTAFTSLPNLLMLEMAGIERTMVMAYTWYLSSMIFSLMILYPLMRKNYDRFKYILAPLIALFTLGYMTVLTGNIVSPDVWLGFARKGLLRGIADIAFGIIAWEVSKKITKMPSTRQNRLLLTLAGLFGYGIMTVYLFSLWDAKYISYIIPFIALSVAITYSGRGYISGLFEKVNVPKWFREYSLCIYICQYMVITTIGTFVISDYPIFKILIAAAVTLIVGAICMVAVNAIKKSLKESSKKQAVN